MKRPLVAAWRGRHNGRGLHSVDTRNIELLTDLLAFAEQQARREGYPSASACIEALLDGRPSNASNLPDVGSKPPLIRIIERFTARS